MNRVKRRLLDKAQGRSLRVSPAANADRNRVGLKKGGQMKQSAKFLTFVMALSTSAMVPPASGQTQPANPGTPPAATPAQQQTQTQQKTQDQQKQQNTHSRAKGAAAGAAIGAATGNAARGAAVGAVVGGTQQRQERRQQRRSGR
jgi:hypothetical protein